MNARIRGLAPFAAALALCTPFLVTGPAAGQQQGHAGHGTASHAAGPAAGPAADVVRLFDEANARMHGDMAIPFTGDADRDFARAMIPHHEGAIAMARIQVTHGKDPELRRIAEAVLATQAREIEDLRGWLGRNPAP